MSRVTGKPNVTRGMQTVLVCDAYRNPLRAYCQRHKCHESFPNAKRDCITTQCASEVRRILEAIKPLIQGNLSDRRRQIFLQYPHSTWDNYLSGDGIADWCGRNRFGFLCTIAQKKLPSNSIPFKSNLLVPYC